MRIKWRVGSFALSTPLWGSLLFCGLVSLEGVSESEFSGAKAKQALKLLYERLKKTEARVKNLESEPLGASEEPVDLSTLNTADVGGKEEEPNEGLIPRIKLFFDSWLLYRPGQDPLSFTSLHNLFLVEVSPFESVQFAAEIRPNPRYYELDLSFVDWMKIRIGKIWVPFDDLAPHNIFGGRTNVSFLAPGNNPFLPDIWTELGMGLDFTLLDKEKVNWNLQTYVVNGFQDGGIDPTGSGSPYPSFSGYDSGLLQMDNNMAKAVGMRSKLGVANMFHLGISLYYNPNWRDEDEDKSQLYIYGADAGFRFKGFGFRSGFAGMNASLPARILGRSGLYGELSQRFGYRDMFKIVARGGYVNSDNGVLNATADHALVGGAFVLRYRMIEFSLHYTYDLLEKPENIARHFGAFRVVAMF